MNTVRLRQLIKLLKTIPDTNFSLDYWRSEDASKKSIGEELQCGTVCCAVGWACSYKPFNKAGLHYFEGSPRYKCEVTATNLTNWTAVETFFGLNNDTAVYLFSDYYYSTRNKTTPQQVVDRIEYLLRFGKLVSLDDFNVQCYGGW